MKLLITWQNYDPKTKTAKIKGLVGESRNIPIYGNPFCVKIDGYEIDFGFVKRLDFLGDTMYVSTDQGNFDIKIITKSRPKARNIINLSEFKKLQQYQKDGVIIVKPFLDETDKRPTRDQYRAVLKALEKPKPRKTPSKFRLVKGGLL